MKIRFPVLLLLLSLAIQSRAKTIKIFISFDSTKPLATTPGFSLHSPLGTPNASFSTGGSPCVGDTMIFYNESSGDVENVHWDFGDGTDTWDRDVAYHIYNKPDVYTVKLTAISSDGQTDTYEDSFIIYALPAIFLEFDGDKVLNTEAHEVLNVKIPGSYIEYIWHNGTDTLSNGNSLDIDTPGTYTVMIKDEYGCVNKDTFNVYKMNPDPDDPDQIDYENIIIVNNVITPNGDNINDVLKVKHFSHYIKPIEMNVFNIWGDIVYTNADYQNDWGATNNGKLLDAGTYYYVIKSEGRKGAIGYVDIIR